MTAGCSMTRQSRMLLIVGGVGLVSVVVLMTMAQRYNSVLEERFERGKTGSASSTATEAQGYVDAFITVRRELKQALDSSELPADPGEEALLPLRQARDRGLRTAQLDRSSYVRIRKMYRNWKSGEQPLTASFRRAFESRREALESLDLGALEVLDL